MNSETPVSPLTTEADDFRDQLPSDLNAVEHVGVHQFPDNSRRRVPGIIYLSSGILLILFSTLSGSDGPFVNRGLILGGAILALFGLLCVSSGWKMAVDEQQALTLAGAAIGFAVGHASAQQVWRGLRSRPTWRVLCYSDEDPPTRRGLVLVDAVDGRVLEHLTQDSLDEWAPESV
ncbi:MAG: hypothetical protein WCG40_00215 [Actinomycetes bacterium]